MEVLHAIFILFIPGIRHLSFWAKARVCLFPYLNLVLICVSGEPSAPALWGIEGRGRRAEREVLDYIRRRKSDRVHGDA
jgi:hypothetical protein